MSWVLICDPNKMTVNEQIRGPMGLVLKAAHRIKITEADQFRQPEKWKLVELSRLKHLGFCSQKNKVPILVPVTLQNAYSMYFFFLSHTPFFTVSGKLLVPMKLSISGSYLHLSQQSCVNISLVEWYNEASMHHTNVLKMVGKILIKVHLQTKQIKSW